MLSVGFWNTKKGKAGYPAAVDFAIGAAGDATLSGVAGETLLCLGEPGPLNEAGLLAALQTADPGRPWWTQMSTSGRFLLASTVDRATFRTFTEGPAFPCQLTRRGQQYLVCFVHLASSQGAGDRSIHTLQTGQALREAVARAEVDAVTDKSILLGDFNMRPYDAGMVAPLALHAAACRVASRKPRKIGGITRPYFYNPCWELLGNWGSTRQPGTFYWLDPTDSVRWHLIDQLLIKPSIARLLREPTPRILTQVGPRLLVNSKGVIKKAVSDHLPIVASLSI